MVGDHRVIINHSVTAIVTGEVARIFLTGWLGKLYGLGFPTEHWAECPKKKKAWWEKGDQGRIEYLS